MVFSSDNISPALCNETIFGKIRRNGLHIVRNVSTQLNTCHLAYVAISGRHCSLKCVKSFDCVCFRELSDKATPYLGDVGL